MNSKIFITGSVSDFYGHRLEGADVHFKDENFKSLFSTQTDQNGNFSIEIEDKRYGSVFICKDYSVHFLEYWHWNFLPSVSNVIHAQIDGLELYGLKAWLTLPTYPGLIVYFRPMSLSRQKMLINFDKNQAAPICPDLIMEDIEATINDTKVKVLGINPVKEFMPKNQSMGAYLLHLSCDEIKDHVKTVSLKIHDRRTNEFGMGCFDF